MTREPRLQIELRGGGIVFRVKVNRTRTIQEALRATGHTVHTEEGIVESAPGSEDIEMEISFFKLGYFISDDNLEKEYDLRGLKAVDLYSLATVNELKPTFSNKRPNGTHWKDKDGKWCRAVFSKWYDQLRLEIHCHNSECEGGVWFAGVSK